MRCRLLLCRVGFYVKFGVRLCVKFRVKSNLDVLNNYVEFK